jgi:CheY-like chemotaxis protein
MTQAIMAKKILLVDDSTTSRLKTRAIFGNDVAYEFVSASDGKEGVEKALTEKPDLILMDVEMPRMTGIEACREIRKNQATKNIPIILMTMRSEASFIKAGRDSGCTDYLFKPVDGEKLRAAVKKLIT